MQWFFSWDTQPCSNAPTHYCMCRQNIATMEVNGSRFPWPMLPPFWWSVGSSLQDLLTSEPWMIVNIAVKWRDISFWKITLSNGPVVQSINLQYPRHGYVFDCFSHLLSNPWPHEPKKKQSVPDRQLPVRARPAPETPLGKRGWLHQQTFKIVISWDLMATARLYKQSYGE